MYEDGHYEFISGNSLSGLLDDLVENIIETFVNEKVDESKSREFYNVECDLEIKDLEEYGVFSFSVDVSMEFKERLLEEEAARELLEEYLFECIIGSVRRQLLIKAMYDRAIYKNIRLKIDNCSRIRADYTLRYR